MSPEAKLRKALQAIEIESSPEEARVIVKKVHELAEQTAPLMPDGENLSFTLRWSEYCFLNFSVRLNPVPWLERGILNKGNFIVFECWAVMPLNRDVQTRIAGIFSVGYDTFVDGHLTADERGQCRKEMALASYVHRAFRKNMGACTGDEFIVWRFLRAFDIEMARMIQGGDEYPAKLAWTRLFPSLYEVLQTAGCGSRAA